MSGVHTENVQEKETQEKKMQESSADNGLLRSVRINETQLSFQTSEAVRMLRANIQFGGYDIKAVALTSCNPDEGKSFVSFELAKSLAELGKKTLFLDCDIRNSVLQARLGVRDGQPGLTDFLVGQAQLGDVLCGAANVPNLYMIFAGSVSPNPSELLSGSLFESLCSVLKRNYDYIIMDTAPLGAVVDATVIGKQCDGVVLVLEAAGTDRKEAQRVKNRLEAADVKILGVVLNKAGAGSSGYNYRKYGSGYDKKYGKYGYGSTDNGDNHSRKGKKA